MRNFYYKKDMTTGYFQVFGYGDKLIATVSDEKKARDEIELHYAK